MADEDVVAISPPSDHKRKLDDVDADQTLAPAEAPDAAAAAADADADADGYAADGYAAAAGSDSPDVKRPRLDGDPEVSETANGNGYPHEKGDEPVEENGIVTTLDGSEVEEAQLQSNVSEGIVDNEKTSVENHGAGDLDDARGTSEEEVVPTVDVNEQDVPSQEQQASDDGHTLTHKIEVPNSKVGVLIGKNGDTIRYLQYNSGVKIQIVRDAEADMSSTTRPVELTGTKENISKAEKLIKDVIAEADAGGSPSLVAKGIASAHIPGSAEQIELKVPNEKVGILIGRGGDTIKSLQTRSGARIQLIPQHLPEGDDSKERVVRLTGDRRQIDVATQMIKEVIKQTPRHSSLSGGFSQQAHRSRGSGGPQWGPRAPYSSQQVQYDYQQRGPYQYQNPQYSSTPYGGYPSPRSGFGPGWEQRAPPRGGSYDFFGGHGGHPASMPPHSGSISGHFSGQSGPPQSLAGYNYGQPRGANYGHPGPYSQAGNPQQNYGHGYEETKYENAAVHPSYGGQNSGPVYSQTAAAAASQTGYAQQYGSSQPIQQYGSSVPSQQAYQYPAGGSVQQTYPTYASAPTTDGSQPGAVYPQQVQAAPAYGQTATTGAYGSYPEQPATANLGYGYQASQDAGYGGGAGATYAAAPGSQTQPGYGQQPTAQLGYDQSVAQSGGYGSVPVSAQASYPQYDSTQVYGAR